MAWSNGTINRLFDNDTPIATPATTIYVTRGSTSSSVYSRITNIDVLCVLTIQTILLHLLDTKPYLEGRDFTQNFPVEEKRRRGRRATTSHE
ncbi:hypothetical protein B9Z55_019827 [Caenorhabditis nigoni]|uniref:Uncharacterized protein n=1 Tax=Caenorhabditis nigoni TaxID=1611254 RepID=A0A2G5TK62_9PELO|nr:hypothetical protein B9Z55_019827 [Caenorhabditis nigoni]